MSALSRGDRVDVIADVRIGGEGRELLAHPEYDVDGVYDGWGTPEQRRIERITPAELRGRPFAAGSMGPKVDAAIRFVEATGKRAAIGALEDIEKIVEGGAGTTVEPDEKGGQ